MEVRFAEIAFSTATAKVPGIPQKKKFKPLNLVFTFPVLVNSKSLAKGDVLVFPHKTSFQIPHTAGPADDEAEAEVMSGHKI